MFFIQKLVNNNLFECLRRMMWLAERKFCRHQSTRAYIKGTAYIKIILKNHVRSYYRVGIIIVETRYLRISEFSAVGCVLCLDRNVRSLCVCSIWIAIVPRRVGSAAVLTSGLDRVAVGLWV